MGRLIRWLAALTASLVASLAGPTASHAQPVSITVGMGYFANVQFAPFYVAQAKGYYRRAGLDVHFRYGIEPDLLKLADLGKVDFVNSGGDEVLTAGARGLHVRYVLTQYSRFPAALFSLRKTGIRRVGDVRGHSIGVPFKFGASYVGLAALLQRSGIPLSRVRVRSIGFTQVESVAHGKVDAAVGYAMNEPVELRHQGYGVQEFDIFQWANIAGAGIATGDGEIARRPNVVRAFVRSTVQGMAETLRNPDEAFRISEAQVPEIKAQPSVQRDVLSRCLDFWRAEPGHALGWMNPQVWSETGRLLYRFKQIPHPVSPSPFYTNRFVGGR